MLAWLVAAAAGWLAVGVAVSARRRPGYRHRRRTISELGEVGAPDQRPVAVGLFLPVGLAAAVVAEWAGPVGARVLGASLAVGYLVAAVAPCDPGCPVGGSARNRVHLLGGAVEYLGVVVGLAVLAVTVSAWFVLPGLVAAVAIGLGAAPGLAEHLGLSQRVAEVAAFAGLAVAVA